MARLGLKSLILCLTWERHDDDISIHNDLYEKEVVINVRGSGTPNCLNHLHLGYLQLGSAFNTLAVSIGSYFLDISWIRASDCKKMGESSHIRPQDVALGTLVRGLLETEEVWVRRLRCHECVVALHCNHRMTKAYRYNYFTAHHALMYANRPAGLRTDCWKDVCWNTQCPKEITGTCHYRICFHRYRWATS